MVKVNKELFKKVIYSPYVQAATIAGSIIGTGASIYRIKKDKDYHKEDKKELTKIVKKLNNLENSRESEKKFSIQGGGKNINPPESIIGRALKYTASHSIFNITDLIPKSNKIIDIYKKLDGILGKDYVINSNNDYDSSLSLYYFSNVIVFYLTNSDVVNKMNVILNNYCKTYKEADYSSVLVNNYSQYIIELNVIDDTENFLVYSFLKNNLKINIII